MNFVEHKIRPIPGFLHYWCSNGGFIYRKNGDKYIPKRFFIDKSGYCIVGLTPTGTTKQNRYKVHRIIALAWFKNPKKLPVVNHKDGNKRNNSVSNLEYVTYAENTQHAYRTGLIKSTAKVVYKLDENGLFLEEFASAKEAALSIGVKPRSINEVCGEKKKRVKGFMWCYKENYTGEIKKYNHGVSKRVRQLTLKGALVAEFDSATKAAQHMGVSQGSLSDACRGVSKTCCGYRWEYIDKEQKINKDEIESTNWTILDDYPKYKISKDGRIYSIYQKRILKCTETQGQRKVIQLSTKDNSSKRMFIHRLVAMAYLPNPNDHPLVNHIDGNSLNNHVNNLEWCTYSHNNQHAYDTNLNTNKSSVIQLDIYGNEIQRFESVTKAAKHIGVTRTAIQYALRGNGKSGGYKWKYA